MKKIFVFTLFFIFITGLFFGIDPVDIISRYDDNDVYTSIKCRGEMIIDLNGKKYEKTFISYGKGSSDYYMEYTNPDDEGTKMMKKAGNLFVYSEDMEEVMPITGHMLRESMMGSDISYEDAVDNEKLTDQYNIIMIDENAVFDEDSPFKGRSVWVLELKAKKKTVSYAKQVIWIDKEYYVALKTEQYALSGTKLKEWTLLEVQRMKNRIFPNKFRIRDLLRKNSSTVFGMYDIELDVNIPDRMFSLRNLEN